ncbi:MAG: hypothetical protein K6T83_18560 [Alicyclobacillus sp.]|nr:hypothetical protein [Alicyclobacillus sp.]
MRKRFVAVIVSPVISLAILGIGLSSTGLANNTHDAKHIAGPATPHAVPPQLQGKPAQPNPDPGIASTYSAKTTDIGFESDLKSSKNLDPGMTPQYPSSLRSPNAHQATPGQTPKTKN